MQSTNIDTHPTHIHQSDTNPSTTTQGRYTTRSEGHHFRLREGSHRAVQAFRRTPHLFIQKSIRNPATIQNPIAILLQSENERPAKYRTRTGSTTHSITISKNIFYIDPVSVSDHTNIDKGFHFPDNHSTLPNLSHVRHVLDQNTQPGATNGPPRTEPEED